MKKEMIHNIIYVILGIIIGVLIMLAVWPKRIAQLSDGSEAVVTVGDKSFSANEYYEKLKGKDKLTTILREVDLYLTKQKYPNRETESTNYANERYDMFVSQAEAYGMDEATALEQYGYSSKKEFMDYLKDDYYLNQYYNEKLENRYTEDELKAYYDLNYFTPRSIYLFSDTDKSRVDSIKKKMDKGTKVSDIVGKGLIAYNQVDITFMNTEYGTEVLSRASTMKKGEVSDVFQHESFGYVFIYVEDVKETQPFEDIKKDILEIMLQRLEEEDPNIMYKVMIELQKENNIVFNDSELQKEYNEYVKEHNK